MAEVDQAARHLVKRDPEAFFRWAAPGLLGPWRFRGFLDSHIGSFPGDPERVCDTVAEFERTDRTRRRLLVDTEAQAAPDPDMLERLGEYAYRLRRERRFGRGNWKYQVLNLLLNLTGAPQPDELDMTAAELGGVGPRLSVAVRTLSREDAAETLRRIERGELGRPVLPWVALMRGADRPAIIRDWKRLAESDPDPAWRGDHGALAMVFATLADRRSIWDAVLGDWDVTKATVWTKWEEQAEQQGLQKGLHMGRLEKQRATLLRVLEVRFGAPPAELRAAIDAETEEERLTGWFDAALTAPTLEAFRAAAGL